MESIRQFFAKFLLFWAGLKLWQKASVFGAIFAVVALLAAAVIWAGGSSYEPLFTGLEVSDQAAIVAYLRENKIPYQLDPAANAILLPRNQVYEVRLSLAQAGLPKGDSVGFERLENSGMVMNEFQQRMAYVRSLEGELQRTISRMDGVESARVGIVIPQQRLFLEEQLPSTASVQLRLKTGVFFGPAQVKTIIHLVSHSVDGLKPEDVTVSDTTGRNLSEIAGIGSGDPFLYGQDSIDLKQRAAERLQERELESKARSILEPIFGLGNVVVRVKVDLDFDQEDIRLREIFPNTITNQGYIRSTNRMEESYTGVGAQPGGPPGTETNIPGYGVSTGTTDSQYDKSDATTNYDFTTRESNKSVTPGTTKRLSASVLVNAELSDEQLARLRSLASSAIGFVAERGDTLDVNAMKFSTAQADAMEEELRRERMLRIAVGAFVALFVLIAVLLTGLWWMRRRKARAAMEAIQKESKHVPTIQEMLTSPDLLAFQGEMAVLEEQLKAYARSNPSEVANLVNEWISSDS